MHDRCYETQASAPHRIDTQSGLNHGFFHKLVIQQIVTFLIRSLFRSAAGLSINAPDLPLRSKPADFSSSSPGRSGY